MLSRSDARHYYDRFGARQDRQAFYEDAALDALVERSDFASARSIVEFGCGTGRFAERLLRDHLAPDATYRAFDQSATMVGLARERVSAFGPRAMVTRTDGSMRLDLPNDCCDRLVASYVLEILSPADQRELIAEAHRLLEPGGLACVTAITPGCSLASQAVMGIWNAIHRARSRLVGGCRPVVLRDLFDAPAWKIESGIRLSRWGIASEILVARRGDPG